MSKFGEASNSLSVALMSEQAGPTTSWVHLIPSGEFWGRDGRGPDRLESADAVINTSRAYAGKRKMVVDYEHQTLKAKDNGQPAPAAGWIVGMQAREDGIWGKVEWTEAGAERVEKREYRYISPVFRHTSDGVIKSILNAALTNNPNLDQLTALSQAEEPSMKSDQLAAKVRSAAALLGLPETTDQGIVLARLRDLSAHTAEIAVLSGDTTLAAHAPDFDPTKYVPIGDFERVVADANKLRQGVTMEAAEHRVSMEISKGNLPPYLKDWAVSLCTVNTPQFDAFLRRVGPAFNRIVEPMTIGKRSSHSEHSQTLSAEEEEVCKNMGLSPATYAAARRGAADEEA